MSLKKQAMRSYRRVRSALERRSISAMDDLPLIDISGQMSGRGDAVATAAAVARACEQFGLEHSWTCFWEAPGIDFDQRCVSAVRAATTDHGYPCREMVSGAGHDACNLSGVAPTSMIFVPCKDGLSHNELENVKKADSVAGANVLLQAVLAQAT